MLQLLAAAERAGELEVRGDDGQRGFLGVSAGRLVSARYDDEDGYLALGAISGILSGGFELLPQDAVDRRDLAGDLEALLERAAVERERVASIREVVPSERTRFRLSQPATERGEITLAPRQWRVLLGVNGERDVDGITDHLRMRRRPAMIVLSELVRGGYVDVIPPAEPVWPAVERRRAPWPAPPPPPPPAVADPEPAIEEGAVEEEQPLAKTPLDVAPEDEGPFVAIEAVAGPAEPVAIPDAWGPPVTAEPTPEAELAAQTTEALAAFGAPPAEEPEPVLSREPAPQGAASSRVCSAGSSRPSRTSSSPRTTAACAARGASRTG